MEKRRRNFLGPVEMPTTADGMTTELGVDVASISIDEAFAYC